MNNNASFYNREHVNFKNYKKCQEVENVIFENGGLGEDVSLEIVPHGLKDKFIIVKLVIPGELLDNDVTRDLIRDEDLDIIIDVHGLSERKKDDITLITLDPLAGVLIRGHLSANVELDVFDYDFKKLK